MPLWIHKWVFAWARCLVTVLLSVWSDRWAPVTDIWTLSPPAGRTTWASDLRCKIRLLWIRMSQVYYIISPDSLIFHPFAQGKAANGVCFGCVCACVLFLFSYFCTISYTFMNCGRPIIITWSHENLGRRVRYWNNCSNIALIWTKYRIMPVVYLES